MTAVDEARAEAEQDGVVGTVVPLVTDEGTADLTVPAPGTWKTRANRALRQGDFDSWAEVTLSEDDYQSWVELDPTNDDVEAFFKSWQDATGENRGKSSRQRSGSKGTRRR